MTTASKPRGLRVRSVLRIGLGLIAVGVGALLTALPQARAERAAEAGVPVALCRGHTREAPHTIQVTGDHHTWQIRYPGPDGVLGTADDIFGSSTLHVPVGVPTRVLLHSRDFIYALRVPSLKVNEVAIPNMEFEVHLDEAAAGRHELRGGQMCGVARPALQGELVVESVEAYWAALQSMETR